MHELERRLEEYGAQLLTTERPISLLELRLDEQVNLGSPGDQVIDPSDPSVEPVRRGWTPWKVAIAACVFSLLVFVPLLLADEPDDGPAITQVPPSLPEGTVPSGEGDPPDTTIPPPELVVERLGNSGSLPFRAQFFAEDGVYYAFQTGDWFESTDGLNWTGLTEAPAAAPPVSTGALVAFYQQGGETYATVRTRERQYRLFERTGGNWVEVPISLPQPPAGVVFSTLSTSTFTYPPSITVIRDGVPIMVSSPHSGGRRIVAMGGVAFGISLEGDHDARTGFDLWRSEDGSNWSEVDLPVLYEGQLAWVYLTAGHDRLMLTIGTASSRRQAVWTSTDGQSWEEVVESPSLFTTPVLPQATDFGWMMMSPGKLWDTSGLFDPSDASLHLSVDGLNWVRANIERRGGAIAAGAMPIRYQAGLFFRDNLRGFPDVTVWRLVEQSVQDVPVPEPPPEPIAIELVGRSDSLPLGARFFFEGGRYYAYLGGWFDSVDGLSWTRLTAAPEAAPPIPTDGRVGFYQRDGVTFATVRKGRESYRLFELIDSGWAEIQVTLPRPPEGVEFIADTHHRIRLLPNAGLNYFQGPPSMTLIQGGRPMMVGSPDSESSGIVTAGGVAYGVSIEKGGGAPSGYKLWRSDDGNTWTEVDSPVPYEGQLSWVYLTAGHDHLMLTIGATTSGTHQTIWTSVDGQTWDEVEVLPDEHQHQLLLPQPTDFGWMITSPGKSWDSGLVDPREAFVLVSSDGRAWSDGELALVGGGRGIIGAAPMRFTYEAGLFVRPTFSGTGVNVWRLVED